MVEPWVLMTLLGIMGACLAVMAIACVIVASDLRRTLRGVNRLVVRCDRAVREAQQALVGVRGVVARADRMTRQAEHMVQGAYATVSEAMERVGEVKAHAEAMMARWFGNGTRPGPRPGYRR